MERSSVAAGVPTPRRRALRRRSSGHPPNTEGRQWGAPKASPRRTRGKQRSHLFWAAVMTAQERPRW